MRPTVALIISLTAGLSACAVATSGPPQLGYAPPSAEPGKPGSAYAGQPAGLIWNQLLDRLIQSPLEVNLADPDRGIVVASYSGDPEPYVSCGWILVQRGDELEEIPASGEASFRRVVDGRRLDVTRGMNLDARLVVDVKPDGGGGAAVETTSNYVLTKTIVAEGPLGWSRDRAHEVVSFSGGGRGEFAKGTVCQPNGALERIVLDVLPSIARVQPAQGGQVPGSRQTADGSRPGPDGQTTVRSEPVPGAQTAEGEPAQAARTAARAGPDPDRQAAEPSGQASTTATTERGGPAAAADATIAQSEIPDAEIAAAPDLQIAAAPDLQIAAAPGSESDEAPDSALAALESPEASGPEAEAVARECPIDDRVFCELLAVTDPYRRANQEQDLGLALDAIEGGNALFGGSDLGFDVSLPSYDAYLTVSFFLRDGTVRHVLSGWDRRWPANAREFVSDAGLSAADAASVELVVALASDVPVFPSPRPAAEGAERYLSDLRQRLAEISNGGSPAQIAASLLVVTPA